LSKEQKFPQKYEPVGVSIEEEPKPLGEGKTKPAII
jgi:hypothetical protein